MGILSGLLKSDLLGLILGAGGILLGIWGAIWGIKKSERRKTINEINAKTLIEVIKEQKERKKREKEVVTKWNRRRNELDRLSGKIDSGEEDDEVTPVVSLDSRRNKK